MKYRCKGKSRDDSYAKLLNSDLKDALKGTRLHTLELNVLRYMLVCTCMCVHVHMNVDCCMVLTTSSAASAVHSESSLIRICSAEIP